MRQVVKARKPSTLPKSQLVCAYLAVTPRAQPLSKQVRCQSTAMIQPSRSQPRSHSEMMFLEASRSPEGIQPYLSLEAMKEPKFCPSLANEPC
ncbi:hypothetical protein DdX_17737 [Ditylenchus destructor]|uniref:Uncharacterized protein n=1 Tax=Ditylenchus destructor TaxID=166010 RepID=A0AAD4MKV7_9BILA|nr:hypothetical protein DdX_17737 [Ditylenchus destructor]